MDFIWKNFRARMGPPHFKAPPKKIFVNLFGLKRPFSNKISRLRWITDRKKQPYTHPDLVERTVVLISVVRSMILIIKFKITLKKISIKASYLIE